MLKKIGMLCALILFYASLSWAVVLLEVRDLRAGEFPTSINLDYPIVPTDMAGYQLYVNGVEATFINVTTAAAAWTGPLTLDDGDNNITVTAVDSIGQESDPSPVYPINPPPGGYPRITTIIIYSE